MVFLVLVACFSISQRVGLWHRTWTHTETGKESEQTVDLSGCTPSNTSESVYWKSIFENAKQDSINLCKVLNRKRLFSSLYGTYTPAFNELKSLLQSSPPVHCEGHWRRSPLDSDLFPKASPACWWRQAKPVSLSTTVDVRAQVILRRSQSNAPLNKRNYKKALFHFLHTLQPWSAYGRNSFFTLLCD
jgi:hypothetical protein